MAARRRRPGVLDGGAHDAGVAAALRDAAVTRASCSTSGRPVCDGVTGRLRYELRATWLGGMRILDRLEQPRSTSSPPARRSAPPTQ